MLSGVKITSYSVLLLSAAVGAIVSSAQANVPDTYSDPHNTVPPVSVLSARACPAIMPDAVGALATVTSALPTVTVTSIPVSTL